MGPKSPECQRSSFIPVFAECSRESDVEVNCISSGHELFGNIKLFIYYSFFFVCLFFLLLKRLVLSFSLVSMKFFFYDSVCLTFQKKGLNHFPANFIFELSEV